MFCRVQTLSATFKTAKSVPNGDADVKTVNRQLRLGSNDYVYRLLFDQYKSQGVVFLESAVLFKSS
jgi:hypothetical protein